MSKGNAETLPRQVKGFCCCARDGEGGRITLCQLHAIEFERRHEERIADTDVDLAVQRARNEVLDALEARLIGKPEQNWSPMDRWIHENIEHFRR